ncbi:DUF4184 family protein [Azospira inquinata]|uniref:DUF4184 family protein n=1 Tax=Azospira inquinata TaxID=2785627 RepID=A0A975SPW4_9RHOO|nr:DUF4184 family protein [Azospira inquinata]QWT49739.1 DUF4184 family protein [Azospira inquinata]
MPWTFAHPAAILPLRKLGPIRMPLAGLVLGSLIPDLGYYIGRFDLATYAHTMAGVLFFCLPTAFILAFFLVHCRQFLLAPLPNPHRTALAHLSPQPLWPLPQAASMAASIILGAATHLAWDAFTHVNGPAVKALPLLREVVFVFGNHPFPAYNLLQHFSTLLGLLILSISYNRWLKRSTPPGISLGQGNLICYVRLCIAALLSIFLGFIFAFLSAKQGIPTSNILIRGILNTTVVFLLTYIALALRTRSTSPR